MNTDTYVQARIDGNTKERATAVLEGMGLSVSEAIRLLMQYVAEEKQLPFAIESPNAVTTKAMEDLEEGRGARFDNLEKLFQDLQS